MQVDGASVYKTLQDRHPDMLPLLARVDHSKQFVEKVRINGKLTKIHTQKADGSFAHVRRMFSNHMVQQNDAKRYAKEFEFFFGKWSKTQNFLERFMHYMTLPFDINVLEGPPMKKPWADVSSSNFQYLSVSKV